MSFRMLARPIARAPRLTRTFRTPFAALRQPTTSPLETAPASDSTASSIYQKQEAPTADPHGATYVVSEADPTDAPYKVPSGAYPATTPYVNFAAAERPGGLDMPPSSTSPEPAHPERTARLPKNESGVGESAAVRNASAPGEMGARGGGQGGLGLQDKAGTSQPDKELDTVVNKVRGDEMVRLRERGAHLRLQVPIQENAERMSELGVKDAWKERK